MNRTAICRRGRGNCRTVISVRYVCDKCGRQIFQTQAFKRHLRHCGTPLEGEDENYNQDFMQDAYEPDDYEVIQMGQYKYVCAYCNYQTNFKTRMHDHLTCHKRACPFCIAMLESKTSLIRHLEDDHYEIQLEEVNKVLDAKDIGMNAIRLNKQVVDLIELMATTLTVDACDSGQSSSSSSCLDSQHNSSCLDSQQEEQSFSYLRNLQALDQDFNGEETYFDEPTDMSFQDYRQYEPSSSPISNQQNISRFKYDDEQQQVVKTFIDPEDLPKMVVGSLMTDLLHRVVNVAQCNKMLRKGGYSPHDGDASDSDELSYGTESDDSDMFTDTGDTDTEHSIITLSDSSFDNDSYYDTTYTIPTKQRQRIQQQNRPIEIKQVVHHPRPQPRKGRIPFVNKNGPNAKVLPGIKSLSRTVQSGRLTGTEATFRQLPREPELIVELEPEDHHLFVTDDIIATDNPIDLTTYKSTTKNNNTNVNKGKSLKKSNNSPKSTSFNKTTQVQPETGKELEKNTDYDPNDDRDLQRKTEEELREDRELLALILDEDIEYSCTPDDKDLNLTNLNKVDNPNVSTSANEMIEEKDTLTKTLKPAAYSLEKLKIAQSKAEKLSKSTYFTTAHKKTTRGPRKSTNGENNQDKNKKSRKEDKIESIKIVPIRSNVSQSKLNKTKNTTSEREKNKSKGKTIKESQSKLQETLDKTVSNLRNINFSLSSALDLSQEPSNSSRTKPILKSRSGPKSKVGRPKSIIEPKTKVVRPLLPTKYPESTFKYQKSIKENVHSCTGKPLLDNECPDSTVDYPDLATSLPESVNEQLSNSVEGLETTNKLPEDFVTNIDLPVVTNDRNDSNPEIPAHETNIENQEAKKTIPEFKIICNKSPENQIETLKSTITHYESIDIISERVIEHTESTTNECSETTNVTSEKIPKCFTSNIKFPDTTDYIPVAGESFIYCPRNNSIQKEESNDECLDLTFKHNPTNCVTRESEEKSSESKVNLTSTIDPNISTVDKPNSKVDDNESTIETSKSICAKPIFLPGNSISDEQDDYDEMKELENYMLAHNITPKVDKNKENTQKFNKSKNINRKSTKPNNVTPQSTTKNTPKVSEIKLFTPPTIKAKDDNTAVSKTVNANPENILPIEKPEHIDKEGKADKELKRKKDKGLPPKKRSSSTNYDNSSSPIISKAKKINLSRKENSSPKKGKLQCEEITENEIPTNLDDHDKSHAKEPAKNPRDLPLKKRAFISTEEPLQPQCNKPQSTKKRAKTSKSLSHKSKKCAKVITETPQQTKKCAKVSEDKPHLTNQPKPVMNETMDTIVAKPNAKRKRLSQEKVLLQTSSSRERKRNLLRVKFFPDKEVPPIKRLKDKK